MTFPFKQQRFLTICLESTSCLCSSLFLAQISPFHSRFSLPPFFLQLLSSKAQIAVNFFPLLVNIQLHTCIYVNFSLLKAFLFLFPFYAEQILHSKIWLIVEISQQQLRLTLKILSKTCKVQIRLHFSVWENTLLHVLTKLWHFTTKCDFVYFEKWGICKAHCLPRWQKNEENCVKNSRHHWLKVSC